MPEVFLLLDLMTICKVLLMIIIPNNKNYELPQPIRVNLQGFDERN